MQYILVYLRNGSNFIEGADLDMPQTLDSLEEALAEQDYQNERVRREQQGTSDYAYRVVELRVAH